MEGQVFLLQYSLAECCKRQLNQGSFVLLYFRLFTFSDLYWVCLSVFSCRLLFCLSVSVKWLAMKTASEMTYIVSSGALNSTPTNQPCYKHVRLSVSLSICIFQKTRVQTSPNFLFLLPWLSPFGGTVKRYVLPFQFFGHRICMLWTQWHCLATAVVLRQCCAWANAPVAWYWFCPSWQWTSLLHKGCQGRSLWCSIALLGGGIIR